MATIVKPGDKVIVRDYEKYGYGTVEKVTPQRVYLIHDPHVGAHGGGIYKHIFDHGQVRPYDETAWVSIQRDEQVKAGLRSQVYECTVRSRDTFNKLA